MLKALELYGFKSFADKTRFDFPPGITVVVGPNGSGKSNIVDAIKWVLGEQSARSLRGKEMADVIFKGSGAGGRKMMNTAEATIIFDNAQRQLPVDADEVHVTRRVYRSGEGEYLINGQPCRLKDIRDMFRGTGVGADAYSLIEQGKVDQLLQASSKDRRAIFEEAAGISRFKAKKLEAERRLERVQQNLLRLSDIVEEVENRLKSIRAQASKARRYREYTERLQQLRTEVAWADWKRLSRELEEAEAQCEVHRAQAAELAAAAEAQEARALQIDVELVAVGERLHQLEDRRSRNLEQIASRTSVCEHERMRGRELDEEAALHRSQIAALSGRADDVQQRLREVTQQLQDAENTHAQLMATCRHHEEALDRLTAAWHEQQQRGEQLRRQHVEHMQRAAQLGTEASNIAAQAASLETARARARQQQEKMQQQLAAAQQELAASQGQEAELEQQLAERAERAEHLQRKLAQNRRLLARRQEDLAQLRGRRRGVGERAAVLEELENKREGIMPGVRQLLEAARASDGDPVMGEVRGIVADLVRADVRLAALVDAALGPASQLVVVSGTQLLERIQSGQLVLQGRVGLLVLSEIPRRFEFRRVQWEGRPGVIGRADRLVQAEPEFAPLIEHLLGRTYFVESLAEALAYHRMAPGRARFVTLQGELLERDGVLFAGPQQASSGLISRRSELDLLRAELLSLEKHCEAAQQEIVRLSENIEVEEQAAREATDQHQSLLAMLSDLRVQRRTLEGKCEHLRTQVAARTEEMQAIDAQIATATSGMAAAQQQLREIEQVLRELEQRLEHDRGQLEQLDKQRQQHLQEATRARVELAAAEQRCEALRVQKRQCQDDQMERSRALEEARAALERCRQRRAAADRAVLEATSALAQLYLEKEAGERDIQEQLDLRERHGAEKTAVADQLQVLRKKLRRINDQLHAAEMQAGEIRHQRTALQERVREDYGVEIDQLQRPEEVPLEAAAEGEGTAEGEPARRESIEEEIASLRRKISNIGAVNMEALEELDGLEMRYASLSGQYQDLAQAKASLERIIQKINADSRRLFLETLEAIRTNFQSIYRKAFGGGKADIILEEGVDELEGGVEILATPPGKPTFSNSLLSGGEKALTAVSLLLAIFQFRPSPFCVLDEVDAPFDEANIGRFIDVLKDFLGWTKFVIVTHSKKTMTAATTLYGVTMQESGVSKRVSVRFEDVSDDGHIAPEAMERAEPDERVA